MFHMLLGKERKGKERKGKERKGKERKGKERKGKERKGKERKGKGREGKEKTIDLPILPLSRSKEQTNLTFLGPIQKLGK